MNNRDASHTEMTSNLHDQISFVHCAFFMEGLDSATVQHSAAVVPSLIGLRIPDGPGPFLPLSSSDTVEGSAHGNNPENRARKTSRKNSHMISESGL